MLFAARACIVVVVVTHEFKMASYVPVAGNLNGSNADMCSERLGRRLAARLICLDFQIDYGSQTFTISSHC